MIESIKLTEAQLSVRDTGALDWLPLNQMQGEFVTSCDPSHRCLFIGDEIVRIPTPLVGPICEAAFKCAVYSAIGRLGLNREDQLTQISMREIEFGARHITVDVTASDGRQATAVGALQLPTAVQ